MFDDTIDLLKEQILQSTCELINIPSVHSESQQKNAPFGKEIANALDYTLSLANNLGFRTKNRNGYCGYVEFGEGKELVGIIGHLDVVPADNTWSFPPFEATIANHSIYGRGAIDDKGPVIASLYAMKAVMDSCPVSKRVRLILGTNEERDWQCMDYYKQHEEIPNIGFSPDADFPCIYAEKGLLTVFLQQDYPLTDFPSDITIQSVHCYNNAINVIPKQCDIILQLSSNIHLAPFLQTLQEIITSCSYSIDVNVLEDHLIQLQSHGISSHAAHPELGSNAISHLLLVLAKLGNIYPFSLPLIDFFAHTIGEDYTGKNLGMDQKDESGSLTLATTQFFLENQQLRLGFNLRIPIHTSLSTIKKIWKSSLAHKKITCSFCGEKEALCVNKDSYLVQTLCNIYQSYTHTPATPLAIGGATYARAFPNCVSFGANFPGVKDMCHQVDECIAIDHLILASKIYAQAIYELAK